MNRATLGYRPCRHTELKAGVTSKPLLVRCTSRRAPGKSRSFCETHLKERLDAAKHNKAEQAVSPRRRVETLFLRFHPLTTRQLLKVRRHAVRLWDHMVTNQTFRAQAKKNPAQALFKVYAMAHADLTALTRT